MWSELISQATPEAFRGINPTPTGRGRSTRAKPATGSPLGSVRDEVQFPEWSGSPRRLLRAHTLRTALPWDLSRGDATVPRGILVTNLRTAGIVICVGPISTKTNP